MPSRAATVHQYLASLPPDRREALSAVRDAVRSNLAPGYEECITYGMIGYVVPHRVYPPGYHCDPSQPLPFASLASQKNHMALYLMGLYVGKGEKSALTQWFTKAWKASGKKLDVGKACVRFKKLDDVPLDVVGEAIRRMPVEEFVAAYEAGFARSAVGKKRTAGKKEPGKSRTPAPKAKAKGTGKRALAKKSPAGKGRATRTRTEKSRTGRRAAK